MDIDTNKAFLTVDEFAEKLRVHPNTIRLAIKKGRISAFRLTDARKSPYRIPSSEFSRISFFDLDKIIEKEVQKRLEGK